MKRVIIVLFLILGSLTFTKAQSNLNDYKYVIVPKQFSFQKSPNQFRLNTLTKFLFTKYGFNAIYEGEEMPLDLKSNYCLALISNVESKGTFKTKTIVTLKDCNGRIVFTSRETTSKEKEYKIAYVTTIREAFKSLESVNYSYIPNQKIAAVKINEEQENKIVQDQEIEKLKEEIKTLKVKANSINVEEKVSENKEIVEEISEQKFIVNKVIKVENLKSKQLNILYAQEIDNGFQVVDSAPKVVMILLTTPKQDVFIVKGRYAIVYKEDGSWFLTENNGTTLDTKTLNIKF